MTNLATERQTRLMTDQATIERLVEFQMEVAREMEAAIDAGTSGHFSWTYGNHLLDELRELVEACQTQQTIGDKYQWFVSRAAFEWSEGSYGILSTAIVASYSTMDRQVDEMARAAAHRTISLVLFDIYQDVKYRRGRLKETI